MSETITTIRMEPLALVSVLTHLMHEGIRFSIDITASNAVLMANGGSAELIEEFYPAFIGFDDEDGIYQIRSQIEFKTL